jgi:hypothetical protein
MGSVGREKRTCNRANVSVTCLRYAAAGAELKDWGPGAHMSGLVGDRQEGRSDAATRRSSSIRVSLTRGRPEDLPRARSWRSIDSQPE